MYRKPNSICLVCDNGYYSHPSQKGRRKTCSLACRTIYWRENRWKKAFCVICGVRLVRSDRITCSMDCRTIHFRNIGKKPPTRLKRGYTYERGYKKILTKDGYKREHRIVAEAMIGRPLKPNEVVHHINFDKQDNRPENLMVMDAAEHNSFHAKLPRKRRG